MGCKGGVEVERGEPGTSESPSESSGVSGPIDETLKKERILCYFAIT